MERWEHIRARTADGLRRRADTLVSAWADEVRGLDGSDRVLGLLEPVALEIVEAVARALASDRWEADGAAQALRRLATLRLTLDEPWAPLVGCLRPLTRRLRTAVLAELAEIDAAPAAVLDTAERAAEAVECLWADLVAGLDDQDLAHRLRQGQQLASFGRPLAHDLRNHAYAVQMQLRLLAEDEVANDPARRERLLQRAREAVKGIGSVSAEHVDRWLAEPGPGTAPASFADLLAGLVQQLRAARADAEILVGGAVPCRRIPDGDRVWLALHAIASFAMARCASPPRLVLRAHDHLDALVVELRDQGPRLDPLELATLFDAPRPEGPEATAASRLWVARRALAHLGGEVQVREHPRGGLVFAVTLPRPAAASARAV